MKFKLILTTEDGTVLDWWPLIGNQEHDVDLSDGWNLSISKLARTAIVNEIIEAIRKAEES